MQENFLKKSLESFQMLQKENRRIAILGGGITGKALANFLKRKEISHFLLDSYRNSRDGNVFSDLTELAELPKFDLVLKSPGVKPTHPFLEKARGKNIPIWSEVEFARIFFQGKVIGITGTDGKSTTTALTAHLVGGDFPKTRMGGNIGTAFIEFCEEDLDFAVLELSSYQLEDSGDLSLDSSTILNLANDHLERHGTMEKYMEAKLKIVSWEDPNHVFIFNSRMKNISFPEKYSCKLNSFGTNSNDSAWIQENKGIQTQNGFYSIQRFPLLGFHNLENLAASILLAESVGVQSKTIQERLESFQGLKHRFQKLKIWEGKEFINDSKSTNLHSMLAGIRGFGSEFFVLILGGIPKVEPLDPLIQRLAELNVKIFMFGECAKVWKSELIKHTKHKILDFPNLPDLMSSLSLQLKQFPPCKVVFSPAGASFDLYKNFEERGDDFIRLVREITEDSND